MSTAKTCPQCRSECCASTIYNVSLNQTSSISYEQAETLPLLGKKLDDIKKHFEEIEVVTKLNIVNQQNNHREPSITTTRPEKFRRRLLVFLSAFVFTVLMLCMVCLTYSFDEAVGENGYEKYAHEAIEAIDHLENKLNHFSGKIDSAAQYLTQQEEENQRLLRNFTDKIENEAQHLARQVEENKRLMQKFTDEIENEAHRLAEQVDENKRLLQEISNKISSTGTLNTSEFSVIMFLTCIMFR